MNTVDFGYKERGYKEQPLIWNKCQRDGFFTYRDFYFAYREQPVIRNRFSWPKVFLITEVHCITSSCIASKFASYEQ